MQNSKYDHKTLRKKAEKAGLWIDVSTTGVMRGRDTGNTNNKERVSRALSWYAQSENTTADLRLIYAVIAYNALYSRDNTDKQNTEKVAQDKFWEQIAKSKGVAACFDFAPEEVENLAKILKISYLSKKYWNKVSYFELKKSLQQDNLDAKLTHRQIKKGNFKPIKKAAEKIQLLRNQVLHGMAAFEDSYNRKQIILCADFLHVLVGHLLTIVINNPTTRWGNVSYPPQGQPDEPRLDVEELKD